MKKRIRFYSLVISLACIATSSQAAALTHIEQLGKIMFQDKDFSRNKTQSCQTCHHHTAGFADPTNARDPYETVVSLGDDGVSTGNRNAPSAAYGGDSPLLHYDEALGEWFGGMFWDGRATGEGLDDPLADQALGPPTNPAEMNMEDAAAVVAVVAESSYANLFRQVFGMDALDDVDEAYDNIGRAIAAYERSTEIQSFSSRYDKGELTVRELNGEALFAAHCSSCHAMVSETGSNGLFTNYGYANIGLPKNDRIVADTDLGLGAVVYDGQNGQDGKFKIPTLRNVAMSAPYGHNGYFATLQEMVDFKNTRDDGTWPEPEVNYTLTDKIGALGLSDSDVNDIVRFLTTLTDK